MSQPLPPRSIDATALAPDLTLDEAMKVAKLAASSEAVSAFVTWAKFVAQVHEECPGLTLAAVVGFPDGAVALAVKAREARLAIEDGARELDWVLDRAAILNPHPLPLTREVEAAMATGARIKAIIEAPALGPSRVRQVAHRVAELGVPVVKAATGRWGATTPEMVREMVSGVAPNRALVKAAGGIRTPEQAWAMLDAGASIIGTSTTSIWADTD